MLKYKIPQIVTLTHDKYMKHFNSVGLKTKKPTNKFISWLFAEAGGFEPPVP